MDAGSWVSIAGAVFGFLGALIGGIVLWRKNIGQKDTTDVSAFRADLLEFTSTLTKEINVLRDRIHAQEEENLKKTRIIIDLQIHVGHIANALMKKYSLTVDKLLQEAVKNGNGANGHKH